MRLRVAGTLLLALGIAAIVVWSARSSNGVQRPNVVLIIGCTVRRDQLGMYGGPTQASPFLTAQAQQGVVFDHGVTAATWTRASSTAIFTGRHPATVGMVEPGPGRSWRRLHASVVTMAEHFQAHGYQTFGATANPNLNEVFGFAQGYDDYVEVTSHLESGDAAKVDGNTLIDAALDRLDRDKRPLFASIVFTDAHAPARVTPAEKARVFDPTMPDTINTYRAMLYQFDQAVARWVSALEERGATPDNTVFVMVNDHGEGLMFPPHHGMGHGVFTYPSTTGMPWIVWGVGVAPGRIGGMASQLDVFPTLTALASLPAPEVPGLQWSAQVTGASRRTKRLEAEVDSWFLDTRRAAVFTEQAHCHVDGFPGSVPICYADEDASLAADAPQLARRVQAFRVEMDRAYQAFPFTGDARPEPDMTRQLEALGYVEGGDGSVP